MKHHPLSPISHDTLNDRPCSQHGHWHWNHVTRDGALRICWDALVQLWEHSPAGRTLLRSPVLCALCEAQACHSQEKLIVSISQQSLK